MRGRRAIQIAGCAWMFTAACMGGDGDAGGPVSLDDLPTRAARALCRALEPCCREASASFDAQACEQTLGGGLRQSLTEADSANFSYDPDAAGACLAAVESVTNLCSEQDTTVLDMQSGFCEGAFQGTLAPGEPCVASVECAKPGGGNASCVEPRSSGPSICIIEPTARENEVCYWTCTETGSSTSCSAFNIGPGEPAEQPRCFTNDGLYCASSGLCEAIAEEGESCDRDDGCAEGLFCDSELCAPLLEEGDACDFVGCGEGLFCKIGSCTAQLAAGEPCDELVDECLNGYCDAGRCVEGDLFGDLDLFFCRLASGP